MPHDAEDCEARRLRAPSSPRAAPPAPRGPPPRRVLPGRRAPAEAWAENEELERFVPASCSSSPDKSTSSTRQSSKLQAGLTLVVPGAGKRTKLRAPAAAIEKLKVKTKFQKRKDRFIDLLRPPYFILTIIIIMAATHAATAGGALPARLEWAPGAWRAEPWRALTYHLVHASTAHLALNALVALVVGWCIEREQGWARAAAVWAGGALGGALGVAALQPRVRVVGASAAVYATLTAHIPNVCLRFGHVPLWWFRPLSVAVLSLSEVCWMIARGSVGGGGGAGGGGGGGRGGGAALVAARWTQAHEPDEEHVAWAAHAFGALVGIPIGFIVFKGENSSGRLAAACRAGSWALAGGGALAALLCYLFSILPGLDEP